jgi:hypothetical protein
MYPSSSNQHDRPYPSSNTSPSNLPSLHYSGFELRFELPLYTSNTSPSNLPSLHYSGLELRFERPLYTTSFNNTSSSPIVLQPTRPSPPKPSKPIPSQEIICKICNEKVTNNLYQSLGESKSSFCYRCQHQSGNWDQPLISLKNPKTLVSIRIIVRFTRSVGLNVNSEVSIPSDLAS